MPTFHSLGDKPYFKNHWEASKKRNFSSALHASKHAIYPNSHAYIKKNYEGCWTKARDRQDIRLATRNKRPLKKDWFNRRERRKIQQLLNKYGEWGARTGKKIGYWWDCRIDFDFFHSGTPFKVAYHWEKSFKKLADWLGIKYDKTKNGVHITLLLKELPTNCLIYHFDKYGKRRVMGSILSANRHAQGLGSPYKESAGKGKWALKAQNIEEVAKLFEKFFFVIDYEKKFNNKTQPKLAEKAVSNEKVSESLKLEKNIKENQWKEITARILQREKLPIRKDKPIYKQWYHEKGKNKQYFLLDTYYQNYSQEILNQLPFGSWRSLVLNKGSPHWFFKRLSC